MTLGSVARRGTIVFLAISPALLCQPSPSHAQANDEVLSQLQEWLAEPLDLEDATASELALLPWIDMGLAEAIVTLREHGGLKRPEDRPPASTSSACGWSG
jgi:hypothetical protein